MVGIEDWITPSRIESSHVFIIGLFWVTTPGMEDIVGTFSIDPAPGSGWSLTYKVVLARNSLAFLALDTIWRYMVVRLVVMSSSSVNSVSVCPS